MSPRRTFWSLLFAAVVTLTPASVAATPAQASAKSAALDTMVARLLSTDVNVSTKGGAASCLHRQAAKALKVAQKTGKDPKAARAQKACNVRRVVVSRIVSTTAPTPTRAGRKATAAAVAGLLRGKVGFARALSTHDFVAVATTTTKTKVVAVAMVSTAPIVVDPTLAGGNQAPVPRLSGRIDYRSGDKSVILDGTASSDDKQIVSYEWSLVTTTSTGPVRTPIGSGPVLSWTATDYATHLFVLTVTDAQGATRTSAPMSVDVWRWTSRGEFLAGLRDAINTTRAEHGIKALSEQSCLTQAAQRQADTLADQHAAAPLDLAALAVTCKRAVRGDYTDVDDYDYNLRVRAYSSPLAVAAMADAQTTTYGLGFAHSKDGPAYYVVLITAA